MAATAKSKPERPDFSLEQALLDGLDGDLLKPAAQLVIGLDEAGRGPWAGPVVAAACWLDPLRTEALPSLLNDSKKLSSKQREQVYQDLQQGIREGMVILETAAVDAAVIDSIGILPASFLAMQHALDAVLPQFASRLAGGVTGQQPAQGPSEEAAAAIRLLVDGNQPAPLTLDGMRLDCQPVIGGDGRSLSIAAASIAAKQTRDAIMLRLDDACPGYGFAAHKGYGTAEHRRALAELGPSPYHRMSFRPLRQPD